MQPETKYTYSGSVSIAYQVIGDGPIDLVMVPGWIFHLEVVWEDPSFERMIKRFLPHFRVILFDKRGTGLSDRAVGAPTLEERMDDIRAVMDAVGAESAVLMGWSEGGTIAALFAATYPERTQALIPYASVPRILVADDYPIGAPSEDFEIWRKYLLEGWGTGIVARFVVPSRSGDEAFRRWFGRYERLSVSPSDALAMLRLNTEIDIRSVLPTIRVPTLVLHQRDDRLVPIAFGRYLADHIPDAKFVELAGSDHLFWFNEPDALIDEILEFLTGSRPVPELDRVLATVLFADIVGSTQQASRLGDQRWKDVLNRYYSLAAKEIERFRGRGVKTLGDGVLATFDGPARAIRCAQAVAGATRSLGVEVRAGLHTGEIELMGDDVGGIAVHIGSRVADVAGANEVVVSSTVKDLVAGSGIDFEDRGRHALKGVPGEWQLFAVTG